MNYVLKNVPTCASAICVHLIFELPICKAPKANTHYQLGRYKAKL